MLHAEALGLPDRPDDQVDRSTAVWESDLVLPTYEPGPPERVPVYLDRRVYQGSSGRVYPLPFHHQVATEPVPRAWRAVHLENEWLHVVVLPELGGRLHVARDRTSGVDLFYANPVIKPALVGLAGPWVAGGIELNWPQHHRPATYLPTEAHVETEPDGSVVVWCSDHDPFTRMKGMHGFRLRPHVATIELEVRLYNRSDTTQSFLWWANVAARVDEDYQSFFPHDVTHVADHARRAITAFPRADRPYYGIDYPARAGEVAHASDGTAVTGDRLDWYRNIPVPTSYMALGSAEDFFGGYDHATGVGFVHVADHQIAVGKKQWTWGDAPFGHAWEANLADDGSHYVELMAGVFTDNQPDFSWIAPGETKAFAQHWYPIRDLGPVDRAALEAAVVLRRDGDVVEVGATVTRPRAGVVVRLEDAEGSVVATDEIDLDPAHPFGARRPVKPDVGPLTVVVEHDGETLVSWTEPGPRRPVAEPEPATEPAEPHDVETIEELALVGTHLELYRHATRSPEPYWREALRRDPGHVDSLLALARRARSAGDAEQARTLVERALARLTRWHANPRDTAALYLQGLVLEDLGDDGGAYDAFGRASWMRLWRAPAGYRMARIDARRGRHADALHRLTDVLRTEPEHLQALALAVICHRRTGAEARARDLLASARGLDPLDTWLRFLDGLPPAADPQTCLDVALELGGVGETEAALRCLDLAAAADAARAVGQTAVGPMAGYHRAALLDGVGRAAEAGAARRHARDVDASWCFPSRLEDARALRAAIDADPDDARAHALLGHWSYAVGRRPEAATTWRRSAEIDGSDAVVLRNLGLTAAADERDPERAASWYERALGADPRDARLLYERDQVAELAAESPRARLSRLDDHADLVASRDDLTVETAHLLLTAGEPTRALALLTARTFQPWEGGEGQVLSAWERTRVQLALASWTAGDAGAAARHLGAALDPPASLGEARHPLASAAQLRLLLGDALLEAGDPDAARDSWSGAGAQRGDFLRMSTAEHSEATFWTVLALRRLGVTEEAATLTGQLRAFRDATASAPIGGVDHFATSLPDLLLFETDPALARDRRVALLDGQLALLDGDVPGAQVLLTAPALASDRHAADLRLTLTARGARLLAVLGTAPRTEEISR